jgi:hypothetical protein
LGGGEKFPAALGRFRGPLLILGGGSTVWADFARVRPWPGEIMAVNDIGQYLHEPLRHWVSLHPEFFPGWTYFRQKHLYSPGHDLTTHSQKSAACVSCTWAVQNIGGSSGLFASFIALMLGYERVVLAGIPMDNTQHFFDPPWYGHDLGDRANEIVWREARDQHFGGRVQSLSGRTREWLGEPKEFIRKQKRAA